MQTQRRKKSAKSKKIPRKKRESIFFSRSVFHETSKQSTCVNFATVQASASNEYKFVCKFDRSV
jgi:hypothetical protein